MLWHHSHLTYQLCGIFPIVHTSVLASFPYYLPALWYLSRCTCRRCGIIPIFPNRVVVSYPLYVPALWRHSHLTYHRSGVLPTVHTSVVASLPSYLSTLWHHSHLTYQCCDIFPTVHTALWPTPLLASICPQDSSDQHAYQTAVEDWVVRQLLDGQNMSFSSRSAQKITLARLFVHPDKPD